MVRIDLGVRSRYPAAAFPEMDGSLLVQPARFPS